MPEYVRITDVSPRDGLQNEPGAIPTADKARLVELLSHAGVDEIEVTSFVSPKWVPQLGDAAELLQLLQTVRSAPSGSLPADYQTSRLAPPVNERVAREAIERRAQPREWILWDRLKSRQIHGTHFRRYHPFGDYILHFYSPSARVAVHVTNARSAEPPPVLKELLKQYNIELITAGNRDIDEKLDALVHRIRTMVAGRLRHAFPAPPAPASPSRPLFSALVPNEKGAVAAIEANAVAGFPMVEKLSVFTAASESFSQRNTNVSIEGAIERFKPVVALAREHGLPVRGYISCVIACPFEGPIDPKKVALVAGKLERIGVDEIDLGDTIGAGTPDTVTRMIRYVGERLEVVRIPAITLHLHDTFGRAAECVYAALETGVRSFDGSVAGLGGCPYASTPGKRAPGNISTETLVRAIHAAGYGTGVSLEKLAEAAVFAQRIVAESRVPAAAPVEPKND